ncbi:MAG: hypothetical protein A2374_05675 [Candidatus Moranbacteria bacterium RIFOXYB1_FULL_44_23]|nr:MAG: hypothetical protein A2194_01010 [Candidatus Moranbacteria bacterium RIFOXYA1_FULL_44_8]OGI40526.1 MAG: hypothetical protein A2374_05675 [Candidatus Moranbacteria bacterium RIFOXYB1_FULL_44_23]OGI42215.1 MAG: hypothetical protein A2593_00415 [Candidatus Moranbacteria bacterium RIFOXYD1_FULL_44_9]HBB36817.1 hypothetical protein [Candidatus Moranbacteria bacterium]HBU24727.1 hypothetical protein [Candidatus Moranbacteria bacterium]
MTKKGIMLGVLGLAVAGTVAYATGALAYRGDPNQKGPNNNPERHEAILKAFENKDYAAWKAQMGDRGAARRVTEQNFARFAEMRQLRLDGKTTEADAIRAELGLGQGNGKGNGQNNGQRGQNRGGNFVDANGDGKCDRLQ